MGQQRCTATVSEIASALGKTPQAIHGRIKRQKWQEVEDARVQGGGEQYDIATLPLKAKEVKAIRTFLARKNVNATLAAATLSQDDIERQAAERERERRAARQQSIATFDRLPAWQKSGAAAKLEIIKACAAFIVQGGLAKTTGEELFTHEYNMGRIDVAPWVKVQVRDFHVSTLRGWIRQEHDLGTMGLVDLYGNRKGQSKIETNEQLKATVIALILDKPHIKAKHAWEVLRATCPEAPYVSVKSVQRFMDRWKAENPQEYTLATNPDAFKNKFQAAFGSRSEGITGPNQKWEIDATPADLMLTDGRHKIIGLCDVGPRRLMFLVTKTERATDNAAAVRRALIAWGVPAMGTLVTDNGTPTDLGKVSFDGLSIFVIEEGGVASAVISKITGLTVDNGLDLDEDNYTLGGDGTRDSIPEGYVKVTGTVHALFKTIDLYNKAVNGTESSIRFGFRDGDGTGSAGNESIECKLPELVYSPKTPPIAGPKGIKVELPFEAYYDNSAETTAIQWILKNTQATI